MRALSIVASLGATLMLAVGCGSNAPQSATGHTGTGAVVTPSGRHLPKLSTAGTPHGEQTVKIEVVATSSRPSRQTLALVPVFIDGHGPLPFALDTGASRSLISPTLAARLHLPARGSAGMLQGVTGAASAENFAIDYDKGLLVLDPAVK